MKTRIIGTGSALPGFCADNDYLSGLVETSDAWIQERTGIKTRRLSSGSAENTAALAAEAGKRALENAGIGAEEIDLLIVATLSPDDYFPSTACTVQGMLEAARATAFDLNAACSGFLFALKTADAYLRAGFCRTALVIGSETISKLLDWTDRSTCILFGDGAGAAVLKADTAGILDSVTGSDGSQGGVLTCKNRPVGNPVCVPEEEAQDYMRMDGQAVFRFAVRTVPQCVEQLLEKSGVSKEEIRFYLLHQANSRIITSVAKRLGEPEEKFPMNLQNYGNTSAASLAILLDECNREGKFKRGDKLILSGFGAGLTWGAMLLEW